MSQRNVFSQYVSRVAADAKASGRKFKQGELFKEASQLYRAQHPEAPARKRSQSPHTRSSCAGKPKAQCKPPCAWAAGAKRQYCHAKPAARSRSRSPVARATTRKPKVVPKLAPALHSCTGLDEEYCDMAPNCYWKPKTNQCVTRSGADVVKTMNRQGLMSAVRGSSGMALKPVKTRASAGLGPSPARLGRVVQCGGYWW